MSGPAAVPAPFETFDVPGGARAASNGSATLTLMEPAGPWSVHARRGIKAFGTPQAQPVEWVRAVIDGVSVYFDGTHVVVTRNPSMWP